MNRQRPARFSACRAWCGGLEIQGATAFSPVSRSLVGGPLSERIRRQVIPLLRKNQPDGTGQEIKRSSPSCSSASTSTYRPGAWLVDRDVHLFVAGTSGGVLTDGRR